MKEHGPISGGGRQVEQTAELRRQRRHSDTNQGVRMRNKTAQWIVWAITMTIFLGLSMTRHFDALLIAIILS